VKRKKKFDKYLTIFATNPSLPRLRRTRRHKRISHQDTKARRKLKLTTNEHEYSLILATVLGTPYGDLVRRRQDFSEISRGHRDNYSRFDKVSVGFFKKKEVF